MSFWVAAAVAAIAAWFLAKSRYNYERLPDVSAAHPADGSTAAVTVIIPARNEEKNIARAVASFPGLTVIVVDDHSTDATAARAAEAGAKVVPAPPLLAGDTGKPNACRAGAVLAKTEWVLFVDADTWYAPGFAQTLVSYAEREGLDMITPFLRQVTVTLVERALLPYAFALYFCGVSAERVNSPSSAEALANGQCMLMRKISYDAIGGHGSVANSVIEDVALARIAKASGLRVRVVRAEAAGSVRMYSTWTEIRRGFEKNSFRFLKANPWTGAQVMLASTVLASWVPALVWLLSDSRWIAAALFAAVPSIALRPWYGRPGDALSAPAAIYGFQFIAISAMFRTLFRTGTIWKGRRV